MNISKRFITKIVSCDASLPDNIIDSIVIEGVKWLKDGEIIGFPTETVYGLGGLATSSKAISEIYRVKNRPLDNPLIVHISSYDDLSQLIELDPRIDLLAKSFWPGPLTIVAKSKSSLISPLITPNSRIAIRMPNSRIALSLIRQVGPIAAPSANLSGKPSPTSALHVLDDLNGYIPLIVDGGSCDVGVESTVVLIDERVEILRPAYPSLASQNKGLKTGIMIPKEFEGLIQADVVLFIGSLSDLYSIAHDLFSTLRKFDSIGVDVIYSITYGYSGIGSAIMNRLKKAAGYKIIKEMK